MVPSAKMQLAVFFCFSVVSVTSVPLGILDVANDHRHCGVEASPNPIHHNPWLVYLEYFNKDGARHFRCAATLIGSRHALTAAHCVKNGLFTRLVARLGEYDLNTNVDSEAGIVADPLRRIPVVDVIIHDGYDSSSDSSPDDIAVLVLEEDAPYTDFIRPICLPTGTVDRSNNFTAAGWGEIANSHVFAHIKKNIISLPYWDRQSCLGAYENDVLPERVICAGGEEGKDTCRGDSGGPLTLVRETTELWGVTSSGKKHCGTQGSPGIYTSVKDHLEWVKVVVERTR